MHETEAGGIAPGPLEVVQQRPAEVAADVHAGGDGLARGGHVLLQVGDAAGVVEFPAAAVPVLGDEDRGQSGETAGQAGQGVVEAARFDAPAEAADRRPVRGDRAHADVVGGAQGRVGLAVRRRGGVDRVVVVHPEEVQRRRDDLQVALPAEGEVADLPVDLGRVGRVGGAEQRLGELPVDHQIHPPGGGGVLGGRARGHRRGHVEGDADPLALAGAFPQAGGRQAVADEQVVGRGEGAVPLPGAGRVAAFGVSGDRGAVGLVQRDPVRHAVEGLVHGRGVVGEVLGGVADPPAAALLQSLGQVPVVEGEEGGDAPGVEPLDQAPVEVEAALVDAAGPLGEHARPGHREPVGPGAETGQQRHVLRPAAVVVAGVLTGLPGRHRPGDPAEGVPDRRPPAVGGHGTLDLVGRGGHAPHESLWERSHRVGTFPGRRHLRSLQYMVAAPPGRPGRGSARSRPTLPACHPVRQDVSSGTARRCPA